MYDKFIKKEKKQLQMIDSKQPGEETV